MPLSFRKTAPSKRCYLPMERCSHPEVSEWILWKFTGKIVPEVICFVLSGRKTFTQSISQASVTKRMSLYFQEFEKVIFNDNSSWAFAAATEQVFRAWNWIFFADLCSNVGLSNIGPIVKGTYMVMRRPNTLTSIRWKRSAFPKVQWLGLPFAGMVQGQIYIFWYEVFFQVLSGVQ